MLFEEGAMATYHVEPLPLRTATFLPLALVCLPLAVDLLLHPHSVPASSIVGQGVICVVALFFFRPERPYDLEIDECGIRKVRNGQVDRAVSRERVRYARESGLGPFRSLTVSERGLAWLYHSGIDIPRRVPGYEQIKAQVLIWPSPAKIPNNTV
jgi:hypothetical protein